MTLHPDTVAIIRQSWAAILGVSEEALTRGESRVYLEKNDSAVLMFVSLFGTGILVGPSWAIEAGRKLPDSDLISHAKLLELSAPYGGACSRRSKVVFLRFGSNVANPKHKPEPGENARR